MDENLVGLVAKLLSGNNDHIKEAEVNFAEAKQNPAWLVPNLLAIVRDGEEGQQNLAVVLLKKAITHMVRNEADDKVRLAYLVLDVDARKHLHEALLSFLSSGKSGPVVRSTINCIAAVGSQCLESKDASEGSWPELLPFLGGMVKDGNDQQKSAALEVFSQIATSLEAHSSQVGMLLNEALRSGSLKVKVTATKTAMSFIMNLDEDKRAGYEQLVPAFLDTAEASANVQDGLDDIQTILQGFLEIISSDVDFLGKSGQLSRVMLMLYTIAQNMDMDESLRHLAVEAMLTFCEVDPVQAKKNTEFIQNFVTLMIKYMREEEDATTEWLNSGIDDDEGADYTDSDLGAEGLDRLAVAIGPKAMEAQASGRLLALITDPANKGDWRNRWTAIKGLAHVAEGCKKAFAKNLANLTNLIMAHITDEHPKVRFEAGRAIAQFCTDFRGEFQGIFHAKILEAVSSLLRDPVVRVRFVGASVIVNFCEEAIFETYSATAPGLLNVLYEMFKDPSQPLCLKQQLLSSISGLSENMGSEFRPYYDRFMPFLKEVFNLPEAKENQTVKGKAIECASFMCSAVGTEFLKAKSTDCIDILNYMKQSTESVTDDDERHLYLLPSWGRMAGVAKEAMPAYLPYLIEKMLAKMDEDDLNILDDDEEVDEKDFEVIKIALRGQGEKRMAIHTAVLEEKVGACDILETFLEEMPELMKDFIQPITERALPQVSNIANEDVREKVACLFPLVMECAKKHMDQAALNHFMTGNLIDKLLTALKSEAEVSAANAQIDAFTAVVRSCGTDCIPVEVVESAFNIFKQLFDESLARRIESEVADPNVQGDEDEEEKLENQQGIEEMFLIATSEAVGCMIKTHAAFIPHFIKEFLPNCIQMLDKTKFGQVGVKLALCVFDDFIEHGREHAMPFFHDMIAAHMQHAMLYEDTAQAAAYGLGMSAEYAAKMASVPGNPGVPQNFVRDSLACLEKICMSKDEEWVGSVCNAVSALLKFVKCFPQEAAPEKVIPAICALLPVGGDHLEARIVHEVIFRDYVATKSPFVCGPNGENMEGIKRIAQGLLQEEDDECRLNDETRELILSLFQ